MDDKSNDQECIALSSMFICHFERGIGSKFHFYFVSLLLFRNHLTLTHIWTGLCISILFNLNSHNRLNWEGTKAFLYKKMVKIWNIKCYLDTIKCEIFFYALWFRFHHYILLCNQPQLWPINKNEEKKILSQYLLEWIFHTIKFAFFFLSIIFSFFFYKLFCV